MIPVQLIVIAAIILSPIPIWSRPMASEAPAVLMDIGYGTAPQPSAVTTTTPVDTTEPATVPAITTTVPESSSPAPQEDPTPQPYHTIPRVLPQTPTPEPTPEPVPTVPRVTPPSPTPAPTPKAAPTTKRPAPAPTPAPGPKCPVVMGSEAICSDRNQSPTGPIQTHRCNRNDQIHTCNIAGDPHISTFEGCPYHFMGAGYHIAAANRRFAAISIQQECGSSSANQRKSYTCAGRSDPVTFMGVNDVSCEVQAGLIVFSDAYANRLDHCDASYACTDDGNDFTRTNLPSDVLVYEIKCQATGCVVDRYDWVQQRAVRMSCSNATETNIGTSARPVWLRRTSGGVRISMDKEFGCKGTVLEYARYAFQAMVDAGCAADRGAAIGAPSTGLSPLYGRTFGLCGHIDPLGRTGCGQRAGNEYSAGGRRRPMYYDRCKQMDYSQFYQMKSWAAIARTTMCGEQFQALNGNLFQLLALGLRTSEVCKYFAPGGARLTDAQDDTWTKFYALADEEDNDVQVAEPVVACDTIDMFFDALGSCNMALLDPSGMSADELTKRESLLQMCLFDACKAKDVGVAMSNTAAFRQSMQDTSWQIEEIIAVAAAVVVGVVTVLVVLVVFWRRRLQHEHRQALLKFQQEVAADQNGKAPIQFAL